MRSPRTTMKGGPCLPQLEEARAQQRRPNAAKIKFKNNNNKNKFKKNGIKKNPFILH